MSGPSRLPCVLLLVAACHRPGKPAPPDASLVAAPAPTAATDAAAPVVPDASAAAAPVDAGAPTCGPTQLQTDACLSTHADLTLDRDAIARWIGEHGGKAPEVGPEACRELALGGEAMLLCIDRRGSVADPAMGINGPIDNLFDVEVLAVRKKQLVKVMKEPLAIGTNGASYNDGKETYFSGSFGATADAIDLEAPPADCTKAHAALPALFVQRKADVEKIPGMDAASKKQLLHATGLEEKATAKHIDAICRAAGHYVLKAGKLHRS